MKQKNKNKWLENKQKWYDQLTERDKQGRQRAGSVKTR